MERALEVYFTQLHRASSIRNIIITGHMSPEKLQYITKLDAEIAEVTRNIQTIIRLMRTFTRS
jgi:hypothetical protein